MYLKISLIFLALLFAGCEKGTTFNPDFYVPSLKSKAIVNESGITISFDEIAIQQYGCMYKNKIVELKLLLRNSKQLKSSAVESLTDKSLDSLLRRMD